MSSTPTPESRSLPCSEEVELEGHIIDSLILPKVLDEITSFEGDYEIRDVQIGHGRAIPAERYWSSARRLTSNWRRF